MTLIQPLTQLKEHQKVFRIIKSDLLYPIVPGPCEDLQPTFSQLLKSPTISQCTRSPRKFSIYSASRLQTPRKFSIAQISQSPTESMLTIDTLGSRRSNQSRRKKKTTVKNILKRRKQTLKIQRQFQKRKPKGRRSSMCQKCEWSKIQNQYFPLPLQTQKQELQRLQNSPKFLQSWQGFEGYDLEAILRFSQNFEARELGQLGSSPEQTALKVMLSFAYHHDELLLPQISQILGQIEEQFLAVQHITALKREQEELLHTYYEQQSLSQIVRLLHEFFSQDYEADLLYRESDDFIGNCRVCLSSSESSANQIVPCTKPGGAMVHDANQQQWYHVLCVLLNSTRFKFKEISRIQSTEIIRLNETDSQTCPSESTFSSSESEVCTICHKSAGDVACISKENVHIMCCVLKGMQMKIQLTEGRIAVKAVEQQEDEYKQQEFEARQQFFRVEKFPLKRKY